MSVRPIAHLDAQHFSHIVLNPTPQGEGARSHFESLHSKCHNIALTATSPERSGWLPLPGMAQQKETRRLGFGGLTVSQKLYQDWGPSQARQFCSPR